MPRQWYYSHGKQKVVGPCTAAEMKELAASGRIMPSDLVRGGRMEHPIQARLIKGLFAGR